jgi:hypothetical protein
LCLLQQNIYLVAKKAFHGRDTNNENAEYVK